MRGLVPRHERLRYRGVDRVRRPHRSHAVHFHARVVQHEIDHLLGILYPLRIDDLRNFGFTDEFFPGEDVADD
jgi:peptide deformylase